MKKAPSILLTILLLSCFRLPSTQKSILPIYYRYKDGPEVFNDFIRQNIELSDTGYCNVGNLITRISINPEGEISTIDVVNPIDSITDSEIIRVIKLSQKYWRKCDSITYNQIFYIQVVISTPNYMPNFYNPKVECYKRLFLEPIIIERYDIYQSKFNLVETKVIINKMNSFLENSNYEEALPLIDELVRRDPFNRDLYKLRIMANFNLGRNEEIYKDDRRLTDFAEGFTLDDILKDKNMSK